MTGSIWLGSIFLKDDGGYELVLRALNHYKKRLSKINASPELAEAPMFIQIVQQEAAKTIPQIKSIIDQINEALQKPELLSNLQKDVPMIVKALNSYNSDLQKALERKHQYYIGLIPNPENFKDDLFKIKNAIKKINEFS